MRYTKKTTVFRFDLLKLRFASLMQADRDVYIEASARASDELARVRSSAVDGSQTVHADATQIPALITLPATAGADAMPADVSPKFSVRATEGSPARACVAAALASVRFTDIA